MSTPILSDADQVRIREAVDRAETQTAGEIVPYIINRSGRYEIAFWRAGVLGALIAAAIGVLIAWTYNGWGLGWLYSASGMASVMSLGGVLAALLVAAIPALHRLLAGQGRIAGRVHHRAQSAFLEEEVFQTRDRTGILLFVSLFEHRIEVIGDAGIDKVVAQKEWDDVVQHIRTGIREGRFADGLVEAITMCGELLHRSGVGITDDDEDELADDVRIRKE